MATSGRPLVVFKRVLNLGQLLSPLVYTGFVGVNVTVRNSRWEKTRGLDTSGKKPVP